MPAVTEKRPMHCYRKAYQGFSVQELLIVLALLAVVSVFAVPHLFSGNQQETATRHKSANQQLQEALGLANTNVGLLPIKQGAGIALKDTLKTRKYERISLARVREACKI